VRSFGCERCYGEDAPVSWRDHAALFENAGEIWAESHLVVSIWRCRNCGQPFVYVWMELIDWHGGDDAQYATLVPVDLHELDTLHAMHEQLDVPFIGNLGAGRRRLDFDRPTRKPRWLGWRSGPFPVDWGH